MHHSLNKTCTMNFNILFVLLLHVFATHGELNQTTLTKKWAAFKQTYNMHSFHPKEENLRKSIFEKRVEKIEDHNERYMKGLETYEMAVNRFAAFTEEEMLHYTGGPKVSPKNRTSGSYILVNFSSLLAPRANAPSSVDWRELDKVSPVKYQGECNSGWAFSVTGAIEAHYRIKYGSKVRLSEQQLVDCAPEWNGCWGADMDTAYEYIKNIGGINYSCDYPYQAIDSRCRYSGRKPKVTIRNYGYLWPQEKVLQHYVGTYGPVSVKIHAQKDFVYYSDGVYYSEKCSNFLLNHAVLVVGYGTENGEDYWLVKNSWGSRWGADGYAKMARNRDNNCGIASNAFVPIL